MSRLEGILNNSNLSITGSLRDTTPDIEGNLNVYTMLTGDGRELELSIVEDYLCWRRVGDVSWIQLVPLSALKPQKGIDYFTEEDIEEILTSEIFSAVPMESISGLLDILNSKASTQDTEKLHSVVSQLIQEQSYVHRQDIASSIWRIHHSMNRMPSVSVKDSAGNTVIGEIDYIDLDNLSITFSGAFSGRAYCN